MKMRTFIGLCAALAFAAGSTAVHALKIVEEATDNPATDDDARASNTYAKELLTTAPTTGATEEGDTTTYYTIAEANIFLSAPADIAANPGDTYLVTYRLVGMVFGTVASIAEPRDDFSIAVGGQPGDKLVVFRLDADGKALLTTTLIALDAGYAISAAGSGSVTRTVTNQTIASLNITGVDGSMVHTASGVIKLGSGLKETSMAMNPTATVEHSFRSFGGPAVATVGSLQVTHNEAVRQNDNDGGPVLGLNEIINNATESDSTVDIMGDFSFATNAYLHRDSTCLAGDGEPTPAAPGILKMEGTGDDIMVVGVNPQHVSEFAQMMYLCIAVDPEDEDGMRIPETGVYTAMGDYEGALDGAAFDPEPMKQTLGMILRDGTTVRFPFLTSQARYNQVLRVTNRGSEATYTFSSDAMDEDMEGMLMGGGMTTRFLVRDLIGDGVGEASGTLIIEAQQGMIDVALVHVNRDDSSTDTWIYQ